MLPLFALFAISFHTDFEGGNLPKVDPAGPDHYVCHVSGEKDQDGRNRQASWYSFRIDGARNQKLTLDMVDLAGEYNYKANRGAITKDTPPFYSDDQKTWRQMQSVEYDEAGPVLRLHITPATDQVWIAHTPPYTNRDLAGLLNAVSSSPYVQQMSAGKTVGGRDIPLLTVTDKARSDAGKKTIWLMFRQHAWESGSSWSGDVVIRYLVSNDSTATKIRQETIVKIFPMCDPDGVARGGVRFNANHYDLNRNWDTPDPMKMPEIAAERNAILQWVDSGHRVDLFLTLHNTETAEYLEGPSDPSAKTKPLMDRIFQNLSAGATFSASRGPAAGDVSTAVGKPGRMSAPQGLYHDRQIPSFLIEMRIAKHPKLGHQPTIEDRQRFGVELIQALWKALENPR